MLLLRALLILLMASVAARPLPGLPGSMSGVGPVPGACPERLVLSERPPRWCVLAPGGSLACDPAGQEQPRADLPGGTSTLGPEAPPGEGAPRKGDRVKRSFSDRTPRKPYGVDGAASMQPHMTLCVDVRTGEGYAYLMVFA